MKAAEVRVDRAVRRLRQLRDRHGRFARCRVSVKFTAPQAVAIHENELLFPPGMRLKGQPRPSGIGSYWDPQGKARPRYLASAAADLRKEMAAIVRDFLKSGHNLTRSLYGAAIRLLVEARERVPVEHGELRDSGRVEVEQGDKT